MSVVAFGKQEEVPGLASKCWLEDKRLEIKTPEDGRKRKFSWGVRHIVLHTTKGIPGGKNQATQRLIPGKGPFTDVGVRSATYCRTNPDKDRNVSGGHHLTIDGDGSLTCHMDLGEVAAFHAHSANEFSIGIEIYQNSKGELWQAQIDAVVLLCDWLTRRFAIQRQVHLPYCGPLPRLDRTKRGADVVGIVGHRDVTNKRGFGDPGDFPFLALIGAGYETFNFASGEDLRVWKDRQKALEIKGTAVDGIPGPLTVSKLKKTHPHGLWIRRPGD